MKRMSELKNCPFCGGEATISHNRDCDGDSWHYIGCGKCGIYASGMSNSDKDRMNWNTRAEDPRVKELVEVLEEAVELMKAEMPMFRRKLAWKSFVSCLRALKSHI